MVGAAQADCARCDSSGLPSRYNARLCNEHVCRHSGHGTLAKGRVFPANMHDAGEIEQFIETFARSPNGGMIPMASGAAIRYRDLILTLAARHKLPAVYFDRFFVTAGGLVSYAPDLLDQFRQAAGYVDRILKGEKPGDLPIQAPTKYETVLNLNTAKALGLDVPATVLARADEVIE